MKPLYKSMLGAVLIGTLSSVQPAMAGEASGYVFDSAGQPVLTRSGGCVHTGSWDASMPACPEPTLVFEEDQGKILFALDDSEFFGFDEITLSDRAKADLDTMINAVEDSDEIHGVSVTGHADQIGPSPYNEQLALKRADSVKNFLISKGIPADRIQTLSDGNSQPLVSCPGITNRSDLIRCLAPNRRVDIEALVANNVVINTELLLPSGQSL